MKFKSLALITFILVIGISLSGCGCFYQAAKGEAAPPKAPEAKITPPVAKQAIPVVKAAPPVVVVGLNDIFFDFDKYNIRPGDAETLKKDAEWFKANAGKAVIVEGHCDERGTVEYNLVLGQKRADSTKQYLVNLGVDGKLIETVSYGKERPFDKGHNEAAWAKNRRSHFVAK